MRASLPFRVLLGLAARNVGRNKARSALSLAAIACGVAGLILSGGFVNDLIFQLGEALIHSQSGHLQIARSGYFEAGTRSPGKYLLSADAAERSQIGRLPHVREIMRRVSFSALLNNGRSSYPVVGEGIEAEKEAKLGTYLVLVEGRALASRDRYGALVGAGVARAMNLKPGSVVSLVAPTVDEAMNTLDVEVVGKSGVIDTRGSMSSGGLKILQYSEKVPADAKLRFLVKTQNAVLRAPFRLTNVPLP